MKHDDDDLSFTEYQMAAGTTAVYPESGTRSSGALSYLGLGIAGEAGEVADKIKKVLRDSGGVFDSVVSKEISKEIGDVLWYMSMILDELGLSLETAAADNIAKLRSRKERGVLAGSGDNR